MRKATPRRVLLVPVAFVLVWSSVAAPGRAAPPPPQDAALAAVVAAHWDDDSGGWDDADDWDDGGGSSGGWQDPDGWDDVDRDNGDGATAEPTPSPSPSPSPNATAPPTPQGETSTATGRQPRFPGRPNVKPKGPVRPAGLAARPIDGLGEYDGQRTCRVKPRVGTAALSQLLLRTYGPVSVGLNRACVKGDTSEHYDGRAIDWMVNSRDAGATAQWGDDFVKWLTMTRGGNYGAMAQRLGVMYVIWRNRVWKSYQADAGWQEYNKCLRPKFAPASYDSTCHRNHVHVSLTRSGARMQTSWWLG